MNQSAVRWTKKRKTKIVATLGPASNTPEMVRALMRTGMDMVRINCSHGEPAQREALVEIVREAARELDMFIPIMFDLQGPKIRIGRLREPIPLQMGQKITIEVGHEIGDAAKVYTSYAGFADDVVTGDQVLLDDGKIAMKVARVQDKQVDCEVTVPGLLKERKGINLPDTKITAPCLSEKDLGDLADAIRLKVDFVAVSFVRRAADMVDARKHAQKIGDHHLRFIAKIERPEALKELIPIINTTDGIMVARGDLGVEIGAHKVPMMQKEIITRANLAGKFVITATQMLDSMIERPVPTRAEATDVANAILDGTDACMLSGETAAGEYPVETIAVMERIALEAESHAIYRYQPPAIPRGSVHQIPDGISVAAYQTANLMGVNLLVAFTNSGGSALRLSKRHPGTFIVGATIHEHIARRMRAYWGVIPVLINKPASVEEMFEEVKQKIIEIGIVREGDVVILTSGFPLWTSGSTNLMRIMEL